MSKSVGNVIDPFSLVNRFGVDYVRFYLAADICFGNDGDFSDEIFIQKVNSELSDDVGNLLQRVLSLVQRNCEGQVPVHGEFTVADMEVLSALSSKIESIKKAVMMVDIKSICGEIVGLARMGNKYINAEEPWKLAKSDRRRMDTVLFVLIQLLRSVSVLLEPIIPCSSRRMFDMLNIPVELRTIQSLTTQLPSGTKVGEPIPLFPKIKKE
jgi:methionyl-tRNA synthetase